MNENLIISDNCCTFVPDNESQKRLAAQSQEFFESNLLQNVELSARLCRLLPTGRKNGL